MTETDAQPRFSAAAESIGTDFPTRRLPRAEKGEIAVLFEDAVFVSVEKFHTKEKWMHPVRRSNANELLYVTEGALTVCEDFHEFRAEKGMLLLLRKDRKHYGTAPSENGLSFWRIRFTGNAAEDSEQQVFCPADPEQVQALVSQLYRFDTTPEYPSVYGDYLLRLLLMELSMFGAAAEARALPARIASYIRSCNGVLKVKDVAEHFDYNEDYITRIFKRIYAKGIKSYIDTVRAQYIKQFLSDTDYSYHRIARETGFPDYASMYSFFKYKTGMTLSAYQSLYRESGENADLDIDPE